MNKQPINPREHMMETGYALSMFTAHCGITMANQCNVDLVRAFHRTIVNIGAIDMTTQPPEHGGRLMPGASVTREEIGMAKDTLMEQLAILKSAIEQVEQHYRTV